MNKLIEIRWLTWPHTFYTDISKMYNVILLHPRFWQYQLYLWSKSLNLNDDPLWKVIKTLIYGVQVSGNLAEYGFSIWLKFLKMNFLKPMTL